MCVYCAPNRETRGKTYYVLTLDSDIPLPLSGGIPWSRLNKIITMINTSLLDAKNVLQSVSQLLTSDFLWLMSGITANKIKRLYNNHYNVQSDYPIKEPVVLIMFLS